MEVPSGGQAEARQGGVVARVLRALTRPLPGHVADYRESARSALIFASLVIVLSTLWLPQAAALNRGGVMVLAVVVAATGVVSLLPAAHAPLNRFGGLLLLAQIVTLVELTGGAGSVYQPLLLMLLLYAALFYDTNRLMATCVLVGVILVAVAFTGERLIGSTAELLVTLPLWASFTTVVHLLVKRIRTSARTDGLTTLWNHATFWALLGVEHERARRHAQPYALLLLDLDHFKQVNDRNGHPVGDEVLRAVAKVLLQRTRASDVVARYGGEEFAVILPQTGVDAAVTVARDLRERVRAAHLTVPVTVSIGVAAGGDDRVSARQVVALADEALYHAKHAGRDHIATGTPRVPAPPDPAVPTTAPRTAHLA